jgi:hypothetical protein
MTRLDSMGAVPLPLARTSAEAHLYMELRPCPRCGESRFEPAGSVVEAGGELASRYEGVCPSCGEAREFTFRLPEEILPPSDENPCFGDDTPSELLDAGEWLWLSDLIAVDTPADPAGLTARDRRLVRVDLLTAAAAVDEVLKFLPPGADAVPPHLVWTPRGREIHATEPSRFRRGRLQAVRDTYRELAARFG